jgi:hypothetical protein
MVTSNNALENKSSRYMKTSEQQTMNSPIQESTEIWKLRCKMLAEKYFAMLKDMRHNLINIRTDAIE